MPSIRYIIIATLMLAVATVASAGALEKYKIIKISALSASFSFIPYQSPAHFLVT